ncbi:hypothetical protein AK812_SmicGene40715 [Symbiodinium microadriaticum]|uniref:Uncharacterized protein n=1 Tax=Symbiodinium microadriaticum TaxID=2951 RepID=A0A1Q9C812_SYMMI|nr:hypothetical protein AK812_SmicGene40715 [Symbiodinium microadriaticum]
MGRLVAPVPGKVVAGEVVVVMIGIEEVTAVVPEPVGIAAAAKAPAGVDGAIGKAGVGGGGPAGPALAATGPPDPVPASASELVVKPWMDSSSLSAVAIVVLAFARAFALPFGTGVLDRLPRSAIATDSPLLAVCTQHSVHHM